MLGGERLRRNERSATGHTEGFGHLANPTGEKNILKWDMLWLHNNM
jgi:hypothetical protein